MAKIKTFHANDPGDPPDGESVALEVRQELDREIAVARAWRRASDMGNRYYRSDQYRRRRNDDQHRINMVINYVRPNADLSVNAVLDAEPVVTPWGRHASNGQFAQTMVDVLSWTRDEEEDYQADIEDGITDTVHNGEGVWYEGFNAFADEGQGMPETKWIDSRYAYWDSSAKKWQRDDAAYVFTLEHLPTKDIQKQWELEEEPAPEGLELFLNANQLSRLRIKLGEPSGGSGGASLDGVNRAWVIRRWKKQTVWERRYFEAGEPATVDGEPMGRKGYDSLTAEEQSQVVELSVPQTELWESVVCGKELLEHHVSPVCKTRGGHGHYPFGFAQGARLRDEGRAWGEIGFLIGISDVRNEVVSMLLDQAFLGNSGYMNVISGSVIGDDLKKVNQIGSKFPLTITTQMGMPAPHWEGINPAQTSVFSNLMPMIDSIQDRQTGHGPFDRGELVSQQYSGRAIRAIQAKADLLGISLRKHIESGMKRITLLRLDNIAHFMRGLRVAEITNPKTGDDEAIYVGDSEQEIVVGHQLQVTQDPQTGEKVYVGPDGKPSRILVLSNDAKRDNVLDKIRLRLDTDREANRIEREEAAKEVLGIAGPGALNWYIRQMSDVLNDSETLLGDLSRYNGGMQMVAKLEEMGKRQGVAPQQLLDMMEQAFQRTSRPALGGTPMIGQGGAVPGPEIPSGGPAPGPPQAASPLPQAAA